MYFAGNFDFTTETLAVNKEKMLKFPVRVPLEKMMNTKKRQREERSGDEAPAAVTTSSTLSSSSAAALNQLSGLNITCVSAGIKHAVCVVNGSLHGIGANLSNQLGGSSNTPQQVNVWRELALTATNMGLSAPIVKVACGRKHTMALAGNGEVYTTGDNTFTQLGHANRKGDWGAVRVGTNNVVQICCGLDTSYALTADGFVYSWGRGESLALGHPITRIEALHPTTLLPIFLNIDLPTRIEGFVTRRVKILEISAGTEHFVARDEKDVFTCGQNSFGKLGTGNVEDHLTPFRVPFPEKKVVERLLQVAAVGRSTVVLKHNPDFGNITYIFGKEGSSQDGTLVPRIVTDVPLSVTRLLGGGPANQMYGAVTDDGRLYTWGSSTLFTSALRACDHSASSPSEVTLLTDRCFVKDAVFANGQMAIIIPDVQRTIAETEEAKQQQADETDNAVTTAEGNTNSAVRFAPDALLKDIIVPYHKRSHTTGTGKQAKDFYDVAVDNFYRQILGEVDGKAFVAAMEKPPPYDPDMFKPKITKQGARSLRNGSKVRVWMSDVYALGTITNANPLDIKAATSVDVTTANKQHHSSPQSPALASASLAGHSVGGSAPATLESQSAPELRNHHFEVTWVRDDWDPEIIELYSDDETINEGNGNRWQKLWFLGQPENGI